MSKISSRSMRIARVGCAAMALVLNYLAIATEVAAQPQRVRERLRVVDSTRVQILTTADGSELVGRITAINDSTLTFQLGDNHLSLRLSDIRSIEERPASVGSDGRSWFPQSNLTSLVLGPTGRTLARGQGQFALYEILFPTLSYGFTDRLSLGAGVTLLPGLGLDQQVVYLLPKVGIVRSESVNIAVGALILRTSDLFDLDDHGTADPFGILYGVSTFGGPDANLTTGLGFGFYGGDIASQPLLQLGGQLRIAERAALISENWFLRGSGNEIVSWAGIRFLDHKVSFDAAVVFSPREEGWFPWVGVTVGF